MKTTHHEREAHKQPSDDAHPASSCGDTTLFRIMVPSMDPPLLLFIEPHSGASESYLIEATIQQPAKYHPPNFHFFPTFSPLFSHTDRPTHCCFSPSFTRFCIHTRGEAGSFFSSISTVVLQRCHFSLTKDDILAIFCVTSNTSRAFTML